MSVTSRRQTNYARALGDPVIGKDIHHRDQTRNARSKINTQAMSNFPRSSLEEIPVYEEKDVQIKMFKIPFIQRNIQ